MTKFKVPNLRKRSQVRKAKNGKYVFWNDKFTEVSDKKDIEYFENDSHVQKKKLLEKEPKPEPEKDFSEYGKLPGIGERTVEKLEGAFSDEDALKDAILNDREVPITENQADTIKEYLQEQEEV